MDRLSTPPSFFENSTLLILLGSSLSLSLVNGTGHDASTKVRAVSNNIMPFQQSEILFPSVLLIPDSHAALF
ncbi:hypothetical protein F5146DRAFT_1022319 [Armillaria mellea]|nr:hypothetical protein F5146DRAFT_1022319 [Armillaria mellea]